MKVSLLFPDREIVEKFYVPVIYTACRTCYSEEVPEEIFEKAVDGGYDPAKMQKLISSVIESGHGSTIEHVVFTFAITGVSRTLSHQLVRHRAGVAFDQQSQRYVKFKGAATMLPHSIAEGDPALRERYEAQIDGALDLYGEMLEAGRARRGRPLRLPQRDAHEPRDDDQPAGAHPHVRPAPVHDGPVGDPPAVPARPPRDLRRLAVPRVVPGAQVRAAGLLRRVQEPRRALPDPAAQGQRAWRLGREEGGGPRRPAGTCRRRDDPAPVRPDPAGRRDRPAPARAGDHRVRRRRRARLRARRGAGAAAVVRAGDVLYEAPAEHHLVRNEGSVDALALLGLGRARPAPERRPVPPLGGGGGAGPSWRGCRRHRRGRDLAAAHRPAG